MKGWVQCSGTERRNLALRKLQMGCRWDHSKQEHSMSRGMDSKTQNVNLGAYRKSWRFNQWYLRTDLSNSSAVVFQLWGYYLTISSIFSHTDSSVL